jgi:hypothetical protein
MKNRVSDILIIALFIAFVGGICAAQALLPDGAVSAAERRKLAQAPEFSVQAVFSGKFAEDAEKYLADQFPLRQQFRTLKAAWQFGVFRAKDNDGVYIAGNSVYSLAKPLEEAQTEALISNTNAVYKKYLSGLKTYFAAVPDKSRGEAEKYGYPEVDHEALDRLLKDGLDAGIKYLGFSPCAGLTADDYYRTDLHWRQERLQPVLDALGAAMDFAPLQGGEIRPAAFSKGKPFFPRKERRSPLYPLQERAVAAVIGALTIHFRPDLKPLRRSEPCIIQVGSAARFARPRQ